MLDFNEISLVCFPVIQLIFLKLNNYFEGFNHIYNSYPLFYLLKRKDIMVCHDVYKQSREMKIWERQIECILILRISFSKTLFNSRILFNVIITQD